MACEGDYRKRRRDEANKVGKWTPEEHELFKQLLWQHQGLVSWKYISQCLGTRTPRQVRTHAQKYFDRLDKQELMGQSSPTRRLRTNYHATEGLMASNVEQQAKLTTISPFSTKTHEAFLATSPTAILPAAPFLPFAVPIPLLRTTSADDYSSATEEGSVCSSSDFSRDESIDISKLLDPIEKLSSSVEGFEDLDKQAILLTLEPLSLQATDIAHNTNKDCRDAVLPVSDRDIYEEVLNLLRDDEDQTFKRS